MSFASLLPRVITAAVLIAALSLFLFLGGLWLRCFILLVALLALWEYYGLFWKENNFVLKLFGLAGCALLFFGSEPVLATMVFDATDIWAQVVPMLASCCMILFCCAFLFSFGTGNDNANMSDAALAMSGLMYIALPLQLTLTLSIYEQILMIVLVSATDSGAYFAGNIFGKRRIWPRVSPNKSLEGCIGGIIASVLVCFVYITVHPEISFTNSWYLAISIGIWLAAGAMMGDFFESALKRAQGVKDSGTILPGHGGVLDRIDSLLFVVPLYLFAKYVF